MAGCVVTHKNTKCRTKVKTGCATCRIRKVKCDEKKPSCRKCVTTGRTCDGYDSLFRVVTGRPIKGDHAGGTSTDAREQAFQPALIQITPRDIELLNRCFSTKTLFDVDLGCDDEARQVLQASFTDPHVRHALSSLRTLREDLETSGDGPASLEQQTPSYHMGIQQYNMALTGVASNLSSLGPNALRSALLCCQLFISIEQVRKNYATMTQHIIQGLRIMHEYRARPQLVSPSKLMSANHTQLPFLDVFVIKLFAAPCKFAEPQAIADVDDSTSSDCETPHQEQRAESRELRTIAPNMRTEITRIAASTLEFLGKLSKADSVGTALGLLLDKAALLDSLDSWLIDLEAAEAEIGTPGPGPISVSFLLVFRLILKIVLLRALDSSQDMLAELWSEESRLQDIANNLSHRVRTYKTCDGISRG